MVRDASKVTSHRESLGDQTQLSPYIVEPTSYNLIICGATNKRDGYLFSDFLGFCMTFRDHGVAGDFWSCFPIEEHFAWLRNDHSPPIDSIKFGKYGKHREKALYSYSRFQYVMREYFFEQKGANILLEEVKRWITEKQQLAHAGDVVNIIIESHGSSKGQVRLGDGLLDRYSTPSLVETKVY